MNKIFNYSLLLSIPIFVHQNLITIVIDSDNEVLLLDRFNKNFKSGDTVAMLDPIETEKNIVRKIVATESDLVFPSIKKGYFLHRKLNHNDSSQQQQHPIDEISSTKVQGPTPQGYILGKVIGSIWPL
ncbi:hypothetical protein DLAC_11480 [Tieghemostelium lacteum]|uniref:Peptidase S26 domain-containing protein n=1 Tax=Tieghemostelium lacteum TaxID=361077 RepID=A0A152A5H2_TIELA|nr:hypothetical protein DLAC_11480 [Tieghemostelium lacteum]|eukprot:KYR01482.1 hypothetical protein DLAC_11480 [Tieghemostelium lacteum]